MFDLEFEEVLQSYINSNRTFRLYVGSTKCPFDIEFKDSAYSFKATDFSKLSRTHQYILTDLGINTQQRTLGEFNDYLANSVEDLLELGVYLTSELVPEDIGELLMGMKPLTERKCLMILETGSIVLEPGAYHHFKSSAIFNKLEQLLKFKILRVQLELYNYILSYRRFKQNRWNTIKMVTTLTDTGLAIPSKLGNLDLPSSEILFGQIYPTLVDKNYFRFNVDREEYNDRHTNLFISPNIINLLFNQILANRSITSTYEKGKIIEAIFPTVLDFCYLSISKDILLNIDNKNSTGGIMFAYEESQELFDYPEIFPFNMERFETIASLFNLTISAPAYTDRVIYRKASGQLRGITGIFSECTLVNANIDNFTLILGGMKIE